MFKVYGYTVILITLISHIENPHYQPTYEAQLTLQVSPPNQHPELSSFKTSLYDPFWASMFGNFLGGSMKLHQVSLAGGGGEGWCIGSGESLDGLGFRA